MRTCRHGLPSLAALLTLGLAVEVPISGHETENTHVLVTFTENTYQIDVVNDPDWLWLMLAPDGGLVVPDYVERDRQLAELTDRFAEEVLVLFNEEPTDIDRVDYIGPVEHDPTAPMGWGEPGMFRLSGVLPEGGERFQFAYGLVVDQYPLTLSVDRGDTVTRWLMTGERSAPFVLADLQPMTRLQVSRQYLQLGYTHILPKGLDHILFVLGLFLLSTRLKPMLLQVTAFTVAHTITLGLAIYGVFALPPAVVEPLIALSIAYVAVENLVTRDLRPWRVALVFSFGLLHGMGFAGVLAELGLPRSEFVTALLSFNVGVEGGQLTVIGLAFGAVFQVHRQRWYRRWVVIPASLVIAATGIVWTIQRIVTP
ncbi:MAG: HupE/UreJ family protein [Vicinamibacterales bacterium]|nr:HupE/UreJ family protein [Vicinamibacterales bacterium]MDP7479477.1 HupE/UreJ family protein [Vicinamibacterales bacterium]HJN45311.1 HupE/UreJ family protein [Vicinamibacterales bacterium]